MAPDVHGSVAECRDAGDVAAIRQVMATGIATTPFPPRIPPFARVALTGGSRGCVASGPSVAMWATWPPRCGR
jgi:hypothetical protein